MRRPLLPSLLLLLVGTGCPPGGEPDDDDDATPDWPEAEPYDFAAAGPWFDCPGESDLDENVLWTTIFDQQPQHFGDENLRNIAAEVELPAGAFAQVGLWLELECPESGDCDDWDRAGSISVAQDMSEPAAERRQVELARFVTPYNRGMCQFIDITGYSPVLTGTRAFDSWIDTWVGPGHAQGDGWRTTVKLAFFPGEDPGRELINVWGRRSITVGEIEPEASVDSQIEPFPVDIPAGYETVQAHLTTTGHSFGNTFNCAEFCEMFHDLTVGGQTVRWSGWRDDCPANPVSPQNGTWTYPRNGWCPGSVAVGGTLDLDARGSAAVDLDILLSNEQEYDNTSPVDLLPYTFVSLQIFAEP